MKHRIARSAFCSASLMALAVIPAQGVLAGDEPLYEEAPDWVVPTELDEETLKSSKPLLLMGQQARIEGGRLWRYVEMVMALDTPQALNQFGTLQAQWLPDKGDLIVHEAVLLRDGEEVNLISEDSKFDVLRRERRLESRMLDGQLTATMAVPGAQLGDRLRLAYSVTISDQALGDEVQFQSGIVTDPFPLADGYVQVSWPKDMEVSRTVKGSAELPEPVLKGDRMVWRVAMPLEEQPDKPGNAPSRFRMNPALQVGTYADWQEVSSLMAPHYDVAGAIAADSDLAGEVAKIAAASDDPLKRTALALELVQEQVSYLLNGLNGGNYLPQMPTETWEKRYGDCKAKSVLLHAILQELGVDSEVVLVDTRGGDALPMLAPIPGNFDHMIVRAEVGGTTYWLDGTRTGTRLDTMDEVPRFFYALPLREEGAGLMEMTDRPLNTPERTVNLTIDSTAGIRVPALFNVEVEYRGSMGTRWRSIAEMDDLDQQESSVENAVLALVGSGDVTDYTVNYDIADGSATIVAEGIVDTKFERDRAVFEMVAPSQPARSVSFRADRTRKEWRDVPLRLRGPNYFQSNLTVLLPEEKSPFKVKGKSDFDEVIGGVAITSKSNLEGNKFALSQSTRSLQSELPAAEIPDAKRAITRLTRALPIIQSGREIRHEWDYLGKDSALLDPIKAQFAKIIADAEGDDEDLVYAHSYRAGFRIDIFDYAGALEDTEKALDLKRSSDLLWTRSGLRRELGDLDGALADLEEIESLNPNGETYDSQIEVLALLGRKDEGLLLAEDYRGLGSNEMNEDITLATAMGWAGDAEEGLQILEDRKVLRPGDGTLLNAICWHAGIWNIVDEAQLANCTEAVERAEYSANVLDSRAMAYYRMGDFDKAKADLDAALLLEPGLTASRLLRGVVRMAQGDKAGREDIDLALAMNPSLKGTYTAWGLDL